MFHRLNTEQSEGQSTDHPEEKVARKQEVKTAKPKYKENTYKIGLEQSAVERYAKKDNITPEDQDLNMANQNSTAPYAVKKFAVTNNLKTKHEETEQNNWQEDVSYEVKQEETRQEEPQEIEQEDLNETNNFNIEENTQLIIEEDTIMNTENNQKNDSSDENSTSMQDRVDIPGNNFQRPNRAIGSQPATPQPASRPAYPGTYSSPYGSQANDADTRKLVIGKGINLSGEIDSCDHLIVEGTVEAALKGADLMDISESGAYFGTVEIEEAVIAGRFEGDIMVNGRLTIRSTGIVMGTISYKEIAIEAGATVEGSMAPIGSTVSSAQPSSKKTSNTKSKKVAHNAGDELPFSDKTAAAAE